MDSQSKQPQSLADRWRSLSAAARWSAGALLLVAILCIAGLVPQSSNSPDTFLLSGEAIPSDKLPHMEAAFAKAGLSDYKIEQQRIRVPQGRASAYMAALAAADALPNNFGDILDRTMRQASPLHSRAQQEELIKVARQNELALIIRSMKGVERAAVLYDREMQPGFARGQKITASVTVQLKDNRSLTRDQVISFGRLVSGAIAGLEPKHISVIDLNSGRSFKADSCDEIEASSIPEPTEPTISKTVASPSRPPKPAAAEEVIAWAKQNTRTLALTGLAIVSLLVMSSVVRTPKARSTQSSQLPTKSQTAAVVADETLSPQNVPEPKVKQPPVEPALVSASPSERHDVAQLVRNDPHAAARVLRGWIGSPN